MTAEQLKAIAPGISQAAIDTFLPHLNKYMEQYEINTRLRKAAFIAQLLHESGTFKYVREIASGSAYEGRKDLGNIYKGDGVKFKGRGLIQVTGRSNYGAASKALFGDDRLLCNPDILATPEFAVKSACWFWDSRGLNKLADGYYFTAITKKINGGYNGLSERKMFYQRALKAIK